MKPARMFALSGPYHLATVGLCCGLCVLLWPEGLTGMALGGGIMLLSTALGHVIVRRALQTPQAPVFWLIILSFKLVGMMALVATVLYRVRPNLLAFAAGLATFMGGIGGTLLHQFGSGWRSPSSLKRVG